MNDEEIKIEMEKYTTALKQGKMECFEKWDGEDESVLEDMLAQAKEEAHKIAIECLNKILTPELKIFIKNLSLDRLQYPDEPIFYKVFGNYPEVEDKISFNDIKK